MERKISLYFLFFVLFFWLLIIGQGGVSSFFGDLNMIDEGQFAAWAFRIIKGQTIYSDIYVQYGPLMVFPVVFLIDIFGQTFFAVRFWNALNILAGFIVFYLISRRLVVSSKVILINMASLALLPGLHFRQWSGVLFIYLTYTALKKNSSRLLILSGTLLSSILFYSIEIAIFSMTTIFLYIFFQLIISKNLVIEIEKILLFLSGMLILGMVLGLTGYVQGWLFDYIKTTLEFSKTISGINLPNGKGLPSLLPFYEISSLGDFTRYVFSKNLLFYWSFVILVTSLSVFGLILTFSKSEGYKIAFLLSLFTLFLYINIIGRSGHYFIIVPFVILLLSFSLTRLAKFYKGRSKKTLITVLFIVYVIFIARHISIFRYSFLPDFTSNKTFERIYPIQVSGDQVEELKNIKSYINEKFSANSKIYILNNSPGLYFILDRQNATKYDLPLLAGSIDKRYAIINELRSEKPDIIIEDLESWDVDEISDRERQPEVFRFVEEEYRYSTVVGRYKLFFRENLLSEKKH